MADRSSTEFSAFYENHYDQLARSLTWTLGNPALATEAVDEAMLRAYSKWGAVRAYENPEGWVYRVALNWARSWLTRIRRPTKYLNSDELMPPQFKNFELWEALKSLEKDFRAVVVCRFFADWSVEQTAEILGIAPGTVKSRLSRALRKLENELHEEEVRS